MSQVVIPPQAYPGAQGGYIPVPIGMGGNAQAELIVSYSRNPKEFAVNKLATITPVKYMKGLFTRLDPASLSQIFSDPNEAVWADGQPRPQGAQNAQAWGVIPYNCIRRSEPYPIGYQERDQSYLPVNSIATGNLATRFMTRRAVGFYTQALNTANYTSNNTFNCTAQVGGKWSAATGTNPYIYQSLNTAAIAINKATNGTVKMTDLTLVLSPNAAWQAAATLEIRDYLAHAHTEALAQIRGDTPGQNANWGLPDRLYGLKLVVDQTLQNIGPRLTSLNASIVAGNVNYVSSDTTAILLCRPGDFPTNMTQLQSSFSTWHFFVYSNEEMLVETYDDWFNKREIISMCDTWDIVAVASESGALIQGIF